MSEEKIQNKYIEQDPPLADSPQLERRQNDYLAYLKEKLNFILATYGRRLTSANGDINELIRTASETTSRLSNAEGQISEVSQRADGIEFIVSNGLIDLSIGGRNLLRQSAASYDNTSAPIATYQFGTSTPSDGEEVTFQIVGNMGSGATYFSVQNNGTEVCQLTSEDLDATAGVYRKTFNWISTATENVQVYSMPRNASRTASIEWVKLERGNQATDWTPAPEDLEDATAAAQSTANSAASSASAAQAAVNNVTARMQFTTSGLKISGTEGSRDRSYVNIGADKQTFVVDNVEVMELGADGLSTQGDITSAGTIKGGEFDTGHWKITENASKVWSLNYHP